MSPKKPGKPEEPKGKPTDGDLEHRLRSLERRIEEESAELRDAVGPTANPAGNASAKAYGRGVRLVSEFVAGILVGGFLGWVFDQLLGTTPLGLIIFILLGFASGILNMARASQRAQRESENKTDGRD